MIEGIKTITGDDEAVVSDVQIQEFTFKINNEEATIVDVANVLIENGFDVIYSRAEVDGQGGSVFKIGGKA